MSQSVALRKLNHVAWRCASAEQTRQFCEDVLGLALAHTITSDIVPSTGEAAPHFHLFFELGDGSCVAFFDVGDGRGATLSADMPTWHHHFAFEVDSIEDVKAMKARLEAAGVDVLGITDHHFIQSIYFFDPNGLRLEVTTRTATPEYMAGGRSRAHDELTTPGATAP